MGRSRRRPPGVGSLAEQAYAEYGDEVGWVTETGESMSPWEVLSDLHKNGWMRAVSKIVELTL
jgi:hypothetical protein